MARVRTINGTAVSAGLAIGPVHVVRATANNAPTWSVSAHEVAKEIERLERAVRDASAELERRQEIVAQQAGEADAQIFAVHRMILQDPGARGQVHTTIEDERITINTSAVLSPRSAAAAAEMASIWYAASKGVLTIHHPVSAESDRTLGVAIFG